MTGDIIVAEDEPELAALISDYLEASGFRVRVFGDGAAALKAVRAQAPDLLVLDLMLPSLDGLGVCKAIRAFSQLPIIIVTARVDEIDRLLGLELGADDYMCKPFSPRELVARVKSILRRAGIAQSPGRNVTTATNATTRRYRIDDTSLQIQVDGKALDLTRSEFRLLATLLRRPGQIYSRAQLLNEANSGGFGANDRAVDSHVKNLRRKIAEIVPEEEWIESVYGVGYRFTLPENNA